MGCRIKMPFLLTHPRPYAQSGCVYHALVSKAYAHVCVDMGQPLHTCCPLILVPSLFGGICMPPMWYGPLPFNPLQNSACLLMVPVLIYSMLTPEERAMHVPYALCHYVNQHVTSIRFHKREVSAPKEVMGTSWVSMGKALRFFT